MALGVAVGFPFVFPDLVGEFTDAVGAAAPPVEQDLLLKSFQLNEEALRIMPMHAGLQYQRGVVALHFEEWEAVTDQAFAAQRCATHLTRFGSVARQRSSPVLVFW